jgi:hypothetical protein
MEMGFQVENVPDLTENAKSIKLTLNTGVGSVPVGPNVQIVGVKPLISTAVRVGLVAPEADGTKTGAAVAADLKLGVPVDAGVWTWFFVGKGGERTLHVKGGASDEVEVAEL